MKFPRIYTDEQGETHIGVLDVPEHEARVGPPPNPVGQMSETEAVSSFVTFSAPAGTEVPSHNAPQPYICIVLAGEGEVEASDGTTLRPGPGELIYCDDVSGKGHAGNWGQTTVFRPSVPRHTCIVTARCSMHAMVRDIGLAELFFAEAGIQEYT